MEIVDAGKDAPDIGQPSDKYPAPHAAPPQVIYYGGPVLAAPKLVPVFFSNDDATTVQQLTDFVNKIGGTQYWTAATSEYGVGPATSTQPVMLTEAAPDTIDDTPTGTDLGQLQDWLTAKLNADDPAWPTNDSNTVYILHYPASTTITASGQASCQAFGGYHGSTNLDTNHNSADVAYAVIPNCGTFGNLNGIDALTGAESHEIVEACTDPYVDSPTLQPAYATVDDAHLYWMRVLGGGEVGDMCAQFPNAFQKFSEVGYVVQRTWSNKAAMAGHDPCQPPFEGEGSYFNAAPELKDTISTTFQGQSISYKGVEIDLGDTQTIPLDLFSDGPVKAPWTVKGYDLSSAFGGGTTMPELGMSLDATQGENGQKLHQTITVEMAGHRGTETFLIVNKNGQMDPMGVPVENWWFGLVGTPTDGGGGFGFDGGGFPHDAGGGGTPDGG